MPFKVSYRLTLQSTKSAGWTMNFWHPTNDSTVAASRAKELAPLLWNMTGYGVLVPGYRISLVGGFRQVQNVAYPTGTSAGAAPGGSGQSDYPTSALLIKIFGSGGYYTEQWIRGLRDECLQNGGVYKAGNSVAFDACFKTFVDKLVSDGWSLRVLDHSTQSFPVSNFNYALGTFQTSGNPLVSPASGSYVRIKGMGKGSPANGVWPITWVTPTPPGVPFAQINNWIPSTFVPTKPPKKPLCTQQVYIYPLISSPGGTPPLAAAEIVRGTSHKTGRPTEVLSGRRRSRAS